MGNLRFPFIISHQYKANLKANPYAEGRQRADKYLDSCLGMFTGSVPFLLAQLEQLLQLLLHVPICLTQLGYSLELPHLCNPATMFRVWDSGFGSFGILLALGTMQPHFVTCAKARMHAWFPDSTSAVYFGLVFTFVYLVCFVFLLSVLHESICRTLHLL